MTETRHGHTGVFVDGDLEYRSIVFQHLDTGIVIVYSIVERILIDLWKKNRRTRSFQMQSDLNLSSEIYRVLSTVRSVCRSMLLNSAMVYPPAFSCLTKTFELDGDLFVAHLVNLHFP